MVVSFQMTEFHIPQWSKGWLVNQFWYFLVKWIVVGNQPFFVLECKEFVEIMQFCWHDAKPPVVTTIKSDLVHIFEIVSGKIQYLLPWPKTMVKPVNESIYGDLQLFHWQELVLHA